MQIVAPRTVEITGAGSVRSVARILADEYSRKILASALNEPRSVEDLSKENGIPLSTCYRRVHDMLREGVVVVEKIVVTADGKRYELYRSGFSSLTLRLEGNIMSIVGTLNDDVAEKVSSTISAARWNSAWEGADPAAARSPSRKVAESLV
jgi:predicted transcriptional regulator